jgi:site-specific DNA-cytosine methylase
MDIKRIGFAYNDPNGYKSQAGRIYAGDGISPSLKTPTGGGSIPFVSHKGDVRSLTPKECFRLQGWTDDYFEKAQLVNSDSQLYKQAGNGVTVNVIEAIACKMVACGMGELR